MVLVAKPRLADVRNEVIVEDPIAEEEYTMVQDKVRASALPKKRMTKQEIRNQLGTVTPIANSRPGLKMKANLTLKNSGSALSLPKKLFSEDN